jgi:sec-independent protein translocase protein TatC
VNNFQKTISKYAIYFEELRRRFISIAKIFAVVFIIGIINVGPIMRLLIKYSANAGVTIITTSPFQMVNLAMSIGFFIACIVTVPILIYHLYSFLKPALLPKETKFFLLSIPAGLILFILGFLYSSIMLYYAIKFIIVLNASYGVSNYWDVSKYLSQIIMASVFFGLVFEFPIILTLIIRMGILKVEFLKKNRRYAMAIIFIFVGLLPPPEVFTTIIQAAPLVFLYEITIQLNSVFYKSPKKNIVEIENGMKSDFKS